MKEDLDQLRKRLYFALVLNAAIIAGEFSATVSILPSALRVYNGPTPFSYVLFLRPRLGSNSPQSPSHPHTPLENI